MTTQTACWAPFKDSQFGGFSNPRACCEWIALRSQAHYINARTMEIIRHATDGLADHIAKLSEPIEPWRRYVYCVSVAGLKLGAVVCSALSRGGGLGQAGTMDMFVFQVAYRGLWSAVQVAGPWVRRQRAVHFWGRLYTQCYRKYRGRVFNSQNATLELSGAW